MSENQERLRQSLLADLTALHGNLDKIWADQDAADLIGGLALR